MSWLLAICIAAFGAAGLASASRIANFPVSRAPHGEFVSQIANFSTVRAHLNAYADDLLDFTHEGMPDLRPVSAGPRLPGHRGLGRNLSGM